MPSIYAFNPSTGQLIPYKGARGTISMIIKQDQPGAQPTLVHNAEPEEGASIRISSSFESCQHSNTSKDWKTSPIIQILARYRDNSNNLVVKFRTEDNYYIWSEA